MCTLGVDGGLSRKRLEHLGGLGESVSTLTDGDVQDELLDLEGGHGVLLLFGLSQRRAKNMVSIKERDERRTKMMRMGEERKKGSSGTSEGRRTQENAGKGQDVVDGEGERAERG